MLKHIERWYDVTSRIAAAFGRLCVETFTLRKKKLCISAAAFGRLCVETDQIFARCWRCGAAAFGRLCVETRHHLMTIYLSSAAAFGRLCVETGVDANAMDYLNGSRLRAAVC